MHRLSICGAALGVLLPIALAQAQTASLEQAAERAPARPKWEAGIAAFAVRLADYPASDEYRTRALPVPYFVYYGRVLQADEQGSRLRRRLTPNVEIDVSGGGAFASDSSDSRAREGMPDLGYLAELGPNLRLRFAGTRRGTAVLLNLPVRGVISIGDSGVNWRGALFAPELAWVDSRVMDGPLSLRVSAASTFATERLHDYFYEVAPRYATAERPAYAASGGYLGSSIGARLAWPFTRRLRGFVSLRYHRYDGAENRDSPLFRSDDGYTAALGLSWSFLQSREPAVVE